MTSALLIRNDLALNFAQISHIGGRQSNQDALDYAQQDDLTCFVVSDGAGGHEGGEIAAHIVVATVIARFVQDASFGSRALQSYIEDAIAQVMERKTQETRLKDMSATIAAVLIDQKNHYAVWAHMWDTRIYLFRRSKIVEVTKDHSLVQQLIEAGYCQPDQLRIHPQRSTLFAAIGVENEALPEIRQDVLEVEDGDAFLICTDGFWEWISEDEMERILALSTTAEEWLNRLSDAAQEYAAASSKPRDNYTAFAIWLGEPEAVTILK